MSKANSFHLFVVAVIALLTMASCASLRGLESNDYVLLRNHLEIDTDIKGKRLSEVKNSLEDLYKQKPTRRNIFNPRTWGAKATIFRNDLSEATVNDFAQLLINRKGFYQAQVQYRAAFFENIVEVTYTIQTGPQYFIDSIHYSSGDKTVLSIIKQQNDETLLRKGMPLDARDFDSEKNRIVRLLQNLGYANFTKNFIEYQGDSISSGAVKVNVHIYAPGDENKHQKYQVGDIKVYTEHLNGEVEAVGNMDTLEGVEYFARNKEYMVKPKGIANAIALKEGDIYRKASETKTYRRLTALSPYRFAIINPFIREDSDSLINYNIFLTPQEKKWIFDAGTNLFYSTFSQGGRNNLLGFNTKINLQHRNFLKRAYSYFIDLEGTFEFDFTNFPNIDPNTISFQIDNRVELPRRIELLNFIRFLNKIKLINDRTYEKFESETLTEISIGYGYNDIFDLYLLNSFNATWSYNYQPNPNTRIRYNQLGLNYIIIDTDPLFEEQFLIVNPLLAASFTDQLFTGLFLRDISFYRQTNESKYRTQWAFVGNFEISGLENYLVNSVVNAFQGDSDYWTLGRVAFAKYIRLESDVRFYKKFSDKTVWASRMNVALAFAYGADENIVGDGEVPFIKQYFVGGPNSLRAWRLRELGPGGFSDFLLNPIDNPFQAGNLKIDISTEFRFKLFWLLDGAIFMDAGNVWLIKDDEERPNGKISSDFFNQIAVGMGWGLRMDFTYFILRFDMGYKLRNPFPDPETGSYFALNKKYNSFPFGNINFAINYPF